MLKQGRLKDGLSLYEHGLQVPAEGAQRWQRSLKNLLSRQKYRYGVASRRGESVYFLWVSKARRQMPFRWYQNFKKRGQRSYFSMIGS